MVRMLESYNLSEEPELPPIQEGQLSLRMLGLGDFTPQTCYGQWWIDHVTHTREYADAIFAKDDTAAAKAACGLWCGVNYWGYLAGSRMAAALMGEHTIMVKTLVDSAAKGLKDKEADYLTDYLMRNLDAQTGLYTKLVKNFPADEWKTVFKDHIVHTGGYILALGKGDKTAFETEFALVLKNRDAMAAFADKIFAPPPIPMGGVVAGIGISVALAGLISWAILRRKDA